MYMPTKLIQLNLSSLSFTVWELGVRILYHSGTPPPRAPDVTSFAM